MKVRYRTKYGAVKVKADGHTFDSRKEAKRYQELCLLESAGAIFALAIHPRYVLIESFIHQGTRYRPASYTADFKYIERGQVVVEDVKSAPTRKKADYVLRKKLFLMQHPEIVFRET